MTSRDVIEHIREAVDFPALVEETIPLPRYPDGKPVLVRCPFHDDHHPSLAITTTTPTASAVAGTGTLSPG